MPSTFTASHRGGSGSPLVCLHGFTDTWRTWDLVLPALERSHDVLAPTLLGHAGGPPLEGAVSDALIVDAVERAMDEAGFETTHIVGKLPRRLHRAAARRTRPGGVRGRLRSRRRLGRGRRVVQGDAGAVRDHVRAAEAGRGASRGDRSTIEGRRLATQLIATNFEHIPAELLAHQIVGVTRCEALPLVEHAGREGFHLNAERIECSVWTFRSVSLSCTAVPTGALRCAQFSAVRKMVRKMVFPSPARLPR